MSDKINKLSKKELEQNQVIHFLQYKNFKRTDTFATNLQNILRNAVQQEWKERPDIVYKYDSNIIGIEHFLVDTIMDVKNNSYSRQLDKNNIDIYNTYHNNIENNELDAMNQISNTCKNQFNYTNNFDYNKFITRLHDIKKHHNTKEYKSNLINAFPNIKITLGIIIEIPYNSHNNLWKVIEQNNKTHDQAIKGIPITTDFKDELAELANDVDFIIIRMFNIMNKKEELIAVIDCSNFNKSFKQNFSKEYKQFSQIYNNYIVNIINVNKNDSNDSIDMTYTFTTK